MLEIKDVDVYYGSVHALKQFSLHVDKGELVTLIGANGAGKSTTIKTISGLLRPTNGTIRFMDENIAGISPTHIVRKGIVHCPEGRRIFPDMSVKDNLDMGAYTRKDKDGIAQDLEKVYNLFPVLKERAAQRAGTLSGGEQQMLAIGRALLAHPNLLMFDEPSLGLAPILVDRMMDVIKTLHQQGLTILLVEQNAELALEIADRAYVLETGYLVIEGTPAHILQDGKVKKAYLGG
jgi:branched-chain amino acid transport system ATP-binding protein